MSCQGCNGTVPVAAVLFSPFTVMTGGYVPGRGFGIFRLTCMSPAKRGVNPPKAGEVRDNVAVGGARIAGVVDAPDLTGGIGGDDVEGRRNRQ